MPTEIKIAMVARPNLYKVPGGDTVQIVETAKALVDLGVKVDIILNGKIINENYSLIHFFNIIDPEDILGHVYKCTIPFVVSTIYVDYREYDKEHRSDALGKLSQFLARDTVEYFKTLAKYLLKNEKISTPRFFLKGHKGSIQYILKRAAALLPNSLNEYKRLEKDYGISKNYFVIPNAINVKLFKPTETHNRDIVLCVARIEGRKNQLNVIRALKDTTYKIVFIGSAAPNQQHYYKQCQAEATSNMVFIDNLPQAELLNYYSKAKVHILASWFETTGLSNLEAGAMGCNLVIGDRGDVRDYFEDLVTYCEPNDWQAIKKAVDRAWHSASTTHLQSKIFNTFTWEKAARKTLNAYEIILKR